MGKETDTSSEPSVLGRMIAAIIVVICMSPIIAIVGIFSHDGAQNMVDSIVDNIMNS